MRSKRERPVIDREQTFEQLKAVRAKAIEHHLLARRFHEERKVLIQLLVDDGLSQADVGRELGVSRQAIQKMLSI